MEGSKEGKVVPEDYTSNLILMNKALRTHSMCKSLGNDADLCSFWSLYRFVCLALTFIFEHEDYEMMRPYAVLQ